MLRRSILHYIIVLTKDTRHRKRRKRRTRLPGMSQSSESIDCCERDEDDRGRTTGGNNIMIMGVERKTYTCCTLNKQTLRLYRALSLNAHRTESVLISGSRGALLLRVFC